MAICEWYPSTLHHPLPHPRHAPWSACEDKARLHRIPSDVLSKGKPATWTHSVITREKVCTHSHQVTHTPEMCITVQCEAVKTHTRSGTGSGIDCTFIHAHRIARASLSVGQHGCVQFSLAINDGEGLHGQSITCTGAHTTSNLCYRYYLG